MWLREEELGGEEGKLLHLSVKSGFELGLMLCDGLCHLLFFGVLGNLSVHLQRGVALWLGSVTCYVLATSWLVSLLGCSATCSCVD